jgi:DnaJ-class molecular chaperone
MELLTLGGLGLAGQVLKTNKTIDKGIIKKPKKPARNFDNIYASNNTKRVRSNIEKLAEDRTNLSKNPEKTGVIPQFYNKRVKSDKVTITADSDSVFTESFDGSVSDTRSCASGISKGPSVDLNDPNCFMRACDNIQDNKKHERRFLDRTKPEKDNYLSQFEELRFDNPGAPVSSNAVPHVTGSKAHATTLETERALALHGGYSTFDQDGDMTYGITARENFTHNNMVPNFKSRTGMGWDPEQEQKLAQVRQRKMEHFTGSANDIAWRPKTERRPLFNPTAGLTNIYGTPVMTDYYESRYIPSYNRQKELPFQQIKVTPGLNLGYNELGQHGFGDSFRVLPKTVDELRPLSKPKITYGGVVIPGMKGQGRGPTATKVFKRRPLTYKEQGIEDMLPNMSYFRAPTIYGQTDPLNLATINRGAKSTPYYGHAKLYNDQLVPESMKEQVRTTVKQQFKEADARGFQRQEGKEARGFDESFDPKITQREKLLNYVGPAGVEENGRTYAFDHISAIQDPTKREIHENTDRAGKTIGNGELSKIYAFDHINAIQDPTKREIHEKTDRAGKTIGNGELSKIYAFDHINAIQDPTKRDIYDKYDRAGKTIGNGEISKSYAFDTINAIQDPTKRDIYDKFDRAGKTIGNGELSKSYAFDTINAIQDPTKRDIYDKYDRAGKTIGNGEISKSYAFDAINAIQDPTKRDIYDKYDRAGKTIGNGEINKSYAFDAINAIQDPTKRDIYNKYDRAGKTIGNGEINKSYAFDTINAIQDPTKRDIYDKYDRAGKTIGNGELSKSYAFDTINAIQDPTKRDLYDKYDRAGKTIGNGELNKSYAFDIINAIQDPTKRDLYDKYDRAGKTIGNGELSKSYAFDTINAIQDPTKRDIYDKFDRAGKTIGNGELSKTYAFDSINAIQDPTRRNINDKYDRAGNALGNNELNKSYALDTVNAIPDPTKRNISDKYDRAGNALGNNELNKSYALDTINSIPDPTRRDIYDKYDRAGNALGFHEFQRNRGDANNMRTNTSKEIIAQGRAPTLSNYEKGPIIDYTVVKLREPIRDNRELYPENRDYATERMGTIYTKYPTILPQQSWHFYSFVDENLRGNPYINNVIHQSPM